MSSSTSSSSSADARKKNMSSLSQLIRERDMKRETLSNLFEEKKRIMDQMKTMNEDLLQLDDDIEALEEAHERKQANQRQQQVQPNSNLSAAHRRQISPPSQVKSEPITTISDSNSSSSVVPLTMNPDEVLSEPDQPTQTTPQRQQFEDDEQLTDPLTWMTQAAEGERRTEQAPASTSAVEQQQQRRRQLHQEPPAAADYHDDDYYYDEDDNDNDEDGSRINNNNNNITDSNNSKNINTSAKLPPLQFESVDGPKPAASMQRTKPTGTLDSFIVRNTSTPAASSSSSSSSAINCPYSQHDIQQTLSQSFRLQNFRENQLEIIQSTLSGKDCFVLMKTGGGKSLLYQLPAILEFPKITLVVSPLLSLIQDQEDQMNGFVRNSCVSFSSGMSVTEQNENWNKIRDVNSGVMMILVTPERVFKSNKLKSELQKLEEQNRLGRFVIDECHCACQWGHDFRPDYAKLQVLRQHFPQVPILAVTATASEQVRKESAQIFQLSRNHAFFRSTADRPNLTYQVRPKDSNVIQDMTDFIKEKHPRSAGIVYTYSKKDADTVARELGLQGIVASAYHSDVTPVRKKAIHQSWMKNRTQVVVATIAFGLGINKPDVRFVFHHTLSKTLESYYQESGRAGRDGKQADCVLFYTPKDVPRMLKMIAPDVTLFMTMVRYAQQFGDDRACRALILQHMGEPNQNTGSFIGVSDGVEIRDVTSHAITLVRVLMHLQTKNVTLNMLNEEWRKKPTNALQCVKNNPPNTDLTKEDCERVIIGLLVNGFIAPIYRYTSYGTVVYLECTENARKFIASNKAIMKIPLPTKVPRKRKSNANTTTTTPTSEDGWIEKSAKRKRASSTSVASKSKKKVTTKKKATTAKKSTKKATSKVKKGAARGKLKSKESDRGKENNEVIEIDDSDDSDSSELEFTTTIKARPRRSSVHSVSSGRVASSRSSKTTNSNKDDSDDLWNTDSENEFEG